MEDLETEYEGPTQAIMWQTKQTQKVFLRGWSIRVIFAEY